VFVHDDVWIDDFLFTRRIAEALEQFDVVGVAGNRRGGPEQCSWAFLDKPGQWDRPENLSGAVAHKGRGVSRYGPAPAPVKLLDGLLLACRADVLLDSGVRFDPEFSFHFYDMDFCRSATQSGLRLGTWPIAVTHASGGNYRSEEWRKAAAKYFAKWRSRLASAD
jgi:GT2 family glycosyltransferase